MENTTASNINYIGSLQEIAQENRSSLPVYENPTRTGPDHNPIFTVKCKYGDIEEEASAATKKEAKVLVAKKVYERVISAPAHAPIRLTAEDSPHQSRFWSLGGQSDEIRNVITSVTDGDSIQVEAQNSDVRMDNITTPNINYIGSLQELAQTNRTPLPEYHGPTRTGPDHNPTFTVTCKYGGFEEKASASNKKEAKLLAAKKLYEQVIDAPTHAPTRLAAEDSPHQLRFQSLEGPNEVCDDSAVTDADSRQVGARNSDVRMDKNPISFLQEYMVWKRCTPKYEEIESRCGTHTNWFRYRVQCGADSAEGAAPNKKEAKTNAAKAMIQLLKINSSDQWSTTSSTTSPSSINYVGELQEIAQKKGSSLPVYENPTRTGPDHNPIFTVKCKYGDIEEEASAATKKEAKVLVAKKVFERVSSAKTRHSDIIVSDSEVEMNSFLETVDKGLEELSIHETNHQAMAESVEKALKLFLPLSKTSTNKAVNANDAHSYNDYHTFLRNAFSDAIRGHVADKLQDLIRKCQDFFNRNDTNKLLDLLKQALKELNIEVKEVNYSVNNEKSYIFGLKLDTNPVISEIGYGDSQNVAMIESIVQLALTICILIN